MLRYFKLVKVLGTDFTFKNMNNTPQLDSPEKQKNATLNKVLLNVIDKLNEISKENKDIKQFISESIDKFKSFEGLVNTLQNNEK